jgi:hypothetical protein
MLLDILPSDYTPEEEKIVSSMAVSLYQKFDDPMDKFIIAMVFDSGYGREETALALGISYNNLWKRMKGITATLESLYSSQIRK